MKIRKCDRNKCFQNICGVGCELLNEPITDRECPFFKTDDEVDEGRRKAHKRLIDIGRKDLIDEYEYNAYRRGMW